MSDKVISEIQWRSAFASAGIPVVESLTKAVRRHPDFQRALNRHLEALALRHAVTDSGGFEPSPAMAELAVNQLISAEEVWVVAVPYALNAEEASPARLSHLGRVSIMAWEWDYHDVLKQGIQKALESLGLMCGYGCQVDTGALPERLLAHFAGIGHLGRNQMLIHPKWGSSIYLGVVWVNDIKVSLNSRIPANGQSYRLQSLEELSEWCIECHACQKVCPGKALEGAREFDVTKCLSNLTQVKRALSETERQLVGQQLYGCDYCQLVCPANHGIEATSDSMRLTRKNFPAVQVFELLEMSNKKFHSRYGHHGFSWRGLSVLKRNALLILGNTGDEAALKFIEAWIAKQPQDSALLESARWACRAIQIRLHQGE